VSVEPSTSEEPRGDAVISSHSSRLGQSKHGDALNSKEKPSRGVAALCPGAVSGGTNTLEEPGSIDVSTHSSRLYQTEQGDDGGAFKPKRKRETVQEAKREAVDKKSWDNTAREIEAVTLDDIATPALIAPGAVAVPGIDGPSPSNHFATASLTAHYDIASAPDPIGGTLTKLAFTRPDEHEGLAIALPVSEQDSAVRVHGTEYDPDAKPNVFGSRRVRLCAIGACILVLAIIGGVLGGVLGRKSNNPSVMLVAPTLTPTTLREEQYYTRFANAVGNELVFQAGTPHRLAAEWIINTDPMQLSPQSDHIIQRYLLTLFYYQMSQNGKSPWRSCNPPTESQNDTCVLVSRVDTPEVLQNGTELDIITFYRETNNPVSGNEYYRWLSGAHECLWAGNLCDNSSSIFAIELCKSSYFAKLARI
jgi:hypothetical protein